MNKAIRWLTTAKLNAWQSVAVISTTALVTLIVTLIVAILVG